VRISNCPIGKQPIYDNITKRDMYLTGTSGHIGKFLQRGPKILAVKLNSMVH
jgi:hypothetical protein